MLELALKIGEPALPSLHPEIAFIGFGEAGQAFTRGFGQENPCPAIRAFDKKTEERGTPVKWAEYSAAQVDGVKNTEEACRDTDIIISVVTADQAEIAAEEVARTPLKDALYLDCNSCAPETKRRSAKRIEAAGGRYVDVAVMTPVYPKLHKAPCLIAGAHAEAAQECMQSLGMDVQIAGDKVGDASVRKMIRSVMIKGLEALTLECFLAARKAGIEDDILSSLEGSFPGFDWKRRAPYMIERAMTHGVRRAAEMKEVAQTLRDLNLVPAMVEATVVRQHQTGKLGLDANGIGIGDLAALTDAILAAQNADK